MNDQPSRVAGRVAGMGLVISAPLVALMTGVALWLLARIASDPPYPADEIPAAARAIVAWRLAVPWLALPALVCAVVLLRRRRGGHGATWTLVLVGSLCLIPPVAIVLYVFIALLAPMYSYRPI